MRILLLLVLVLLMFLLPFSFPHLKNPISNWETPYALGEYDGHQYLQNNFDMMHGNTQCVGSWNFVATFMFV